MLVQLSGQLSALLSGLLLERMSAQLSGQLSALLSGLLVELMSAQLSGPMSAFVSAQLARYPAYPLTCAPGSVCKLGQKLPLRNLVNLLRNSCEAVACSATVSTMHYDAV